MAASVYEFGDFRLDCGRFELRRGGRSVRLERKPMELLILLAGSDGRLVTRVEIARHLWESEVFVDTEHGINTAVRKIRQALGDDPEQPRFLQTVTGMGYRFIAPLARWEGAVEDGASLARGGEVEAGAAALSAVAPGSQARTRVARWRRLARDTLKRRLGERDG